MTHLTRRRFLESTTLAGAGALAASALPLRAAEKVSANGRLSAAVLGVKGRGVSHVQAMLRPDCDIAYIVDPDAKVGAAVVESVRQKTGKAPAYEPDLRRVLDDKSVDFITVATPNHWHALAGIWAMQAGKHVYVEKPVSHNVSEGRRLVEAARKYNRICQTGTQCRSAAGPIESIKFLHDGGIGDVKFARGVVYRPREAIGPKGDYAPPPEVNYTLWQGPAPERPITRPKFHYDWHWQYHWGNGDLGNLGPHVYDLCRWGLKMDSLGEKVISYGGRLGYEDAGESANTQVAIHTAGDKTLVLEVRGLPTRPFEEVKPKKLKIGLVFYGTAGTLLLDNFYYSAAYDLDGKLIKNFYDPSKEKVDGTNGHFDNFIKAVRSGNASDLTADILEGHLSAGLPHVGTISYRLGKPASVEEIRSQLESVKCHDNCVDTLDRMVKHLEKNGVNPNATKMTLGPTLEIDSKSETFTNNDAANAMLTREYRDGFVVPAAGQV